MKKFLNENKHKVAGIFILVLICFSLFTNTVNASFGYKFGAVSLTQAESGFKDLAECTTSLTNNKKKLPGWTFTDCVEATDLAPIIPIRPVTNMDLPVPVAREKSPTINADGIYKLLAPIGKLTSINTSSNGTCPGNPDITNGVACYLNIIFKIGIGLAGALAVVMIVVASIQYMGDESVFGKTEAKGKIFSAILGLIIALAAYAILNTVNPDLTGSGGVTIDDVSFEISEELDGTGESTIDGKVIKVSTSKIKYAKEYSNQTACAGMNATQSAPNVSTCVKYPTGIQSSAPGQYLEKSFSEKLTKFNSILQSRKMPWRITEAWPGFRSHKAICHKIGVCIDMNHIIQGGTDPNPTPTTAQVKIVVEAAASLGMCAQYEILKDTNLNNQLVKAGLGKNVIFFGGKWISANHYSLYNGTCS